MQSAITLIGLHIHTVLLEAPVFIQGFYETYNFYRDNISGSYHTERMPRCICTGILTSQGSWCNSCIQMLHGKINGQQYQGLNLVALHYHFIAVPTPNTVKLPYDLWNFPWIFKAFQGWQKFLFSNFFYVPRCTPKQTLKGRKNTYGFIWTWTSTSWISSEP